MTMTRLFHTFIKIFEVVRRSKEIKFKNSVLLRILNSSLQMSTSNRTKCSDNSASAFELRQLFFFTKH